MSHGDVSQSSCLHISFFKWLNFELDLICVWKLKNEKITFLKLKVSSFGIRSLHMSTTTIIRISYSNSKYSSISMQLHIIRLTQFQFHSNIFKFNTSTLNTLNQSFNECEWLFFCCYFLLFFVQTYYEIECHWVRLL